MQCFHRWTKVFNGGTKGPWSAEDDARVAELVGQIGAKKWSCIAAQLPGRTGKQCRERWHNHLNPHISKVPWSEHEVGCQVLSCHADAAVAAAALDAVAQSCLGCMCCCV